MWDHHSTYQLLLQDGHLPFVCSNVPIYPFHHLQELILGRFAWRGRGGLHWRLCLWLVILFLPHDIIITVNIFQVCTESSDLGWRTRFHILRTSRNDTSQVGGTRYRICTVRCVNLRWSLAGDINKQTRPFGRDFLVMGIIFGHIVVILGIWLVVVVICRAGVIVGIGVASRIHLGLMVTRTISVILHSTWGLIPIAIIGAKVWPITAENKRFYDQWINWILLYKAISIMAVSFKWNNVNWLSHYSQWALYRETTKGNECHVCHINTCNWLHAYKHLSPIPVQSSGIVVMLAMKFRQHWGTLSVTTHCKVSVPEKSRMRD